jgi:protein-disulfide isomerase
MATSDQRVRSAGAFVCRIAILTFAATLAAGCKPSADPASGRSGGPKSDASTSVTPASAATPTGEAAGAAKSDLLTRADSGRIRGQASAPIWIVEVSDFQCPYCKLWHDETYKQVVAEYVQTGKARLAYVHHPLSIHANAVPAAEATMCASAQGKFWEMHDAVFDAQERWAALSNPSQVLDSLATSVGATMPAWRECMSSHATVPLIQADRDRSASAGVRSTPSFLIGSEVIMGAQPIGVFRETVERALKAAAQRPAGTPPAR